MAITLKNPASDFASALTTQSVGGVTLTSGANLFFRYLHPTPLDLSVYLLNNGGEAPEAYLSTTDQAVFHAQVQALIYGAPGEDGFDQAETLARGVLGFMQQNVLSGYISVFALSSQPLHIIEPDTQRHIFSIDFEARYGA